jgi:hypothetical protein
VLATAEALVATGDLALIRDDSLRSSITAYIESSREVVSEQEGDLQQWRESLFRIEVGLDPIEAYFGAAETTQLPRTMRSLGMSLGDPTLEAMTADSLRAMFRRLDLPVPETLRIRSPLDMDAFLSDPELRNAAWVMARATFNLKTRRAIARDEALALLGHVEARIDP